MSRNGDRIGTKSKLRKECQGKSTAALHRAAHRQVFGRKHKATVVQVDSTTTQI